jgi:hypothetical protein
MRKAFVFIFAICTGYVSMAQSNDELAMLRDMFGKEKKDIISQFLDFSAADSAKFWPLYEEYSAKRKALGDDRISIIKDYADQYTNLTNEQAQKLGDRLFKNEAGILKLQQQYYKKMSKAVSPLKATQFIQTEIYLQTQLRAVIQDEIPFIGELDKTKKN